MSVKDRLKKGLLLTTAAALLTTGVPRINTRALENDSTTSDPYVSCQFEQSALPGESYVHGKILVRTPGLDRDAADDVIETENPKLADIYFEDDEVYGPIAKVTTHRGLEYFYKIYLEKHPDEFPEVIGADLNYGVGTTQGNAPGELLISFKPGTDKERIAEIVRDFIPELDSYDSEMGIGIVDVPPDKEIDFLYWYMDEEGVECVDLLKPQ